MLNHDSINYPNDEYEIDLATLHPPDVGEDGSDDGEGDPDEPSFEDDPILSGFTPVDLDGEPSLLYQERVWQYDSEQQTLRPWMVVRAKWDEEQGLHRSMEELTRVARDLIQTLIEQKYTFVMLETGIFYDEDLWMVCCHLLPDEIGTSVLIHLSINDHRIINDTPRNIDTFVEEYERVEHLAIGTGQLPPKRGMLDNARWILHDRVSRDQEMVAWLSVERERLRGLFYLNGLPHPELDDDDHPF